MRKIVLSGMRPTGKLHLGNYYGALENWVNLQADYECYFFVADWHALTTGYNDTTELSSNVYEMVIDWISAGLAPDKCTMFLQSALSEHAELNLMLSMITPLSWLTRCPTYKDVLAQMKDRDIATHGFLGYPCLQAADILIYNADCVPVGEDQLPHLELTRELARRFNYLYGDTFKEPQALLTKAKVLSGTDGRKMSKSYNNTIMMSDSPDEVKKKVMTMVTDPARIKKDDPGHPDVCSVFSFHRVLKSDSDSGDIQDIETKCKSGGIGCVQCKRLLAEKLCERISPMYNKRCELGKNPDFVKEVLIEGTRRARDKAQKMVKIAKKAMNITEL